MDQVWSGWKRCPDAQSGDSVEAPIGPGVYEVRHTLTGRLIAFGHAGNVASAIAELKMDRTNALTRLFKPAPLTSRVSELEYRTWAAASRADAKTAAQRLKGLRQVAWRRRVDLGSTVRH
ncbi:MAG: hypothetical protein ACREDY_03640 [Bradyrhizobium sp.]